MLVYSSLSVSEVSHHCLCNAGVYLLDMSTERVLVVNGVCALSDHNVRDRRFEVLPRQSPNVDVSLIILLDKRFSSKSAS